VVGAAHFSVAHFSVAASQSAVHRATARAQSAATGRRVLVARSVVAAAMGRKVLVGVATTYEVDKDMAVEPVYNRPRAMPPLLYE